MAQNPTIHRTIKLMGLLLVTSVVGVVITFFGASSPQSLFLRNIEVDVSCLGDTYITSYVINAHRDEGYVGIILVPVTKSPKSSCEGITVFSGSIDLRETYIADWNDFTRRRPEPSQVADFADISRSQIAFDNEELVRRRAFALIIPIDDLVVDVGSGAWSTTLQVVTTYRNANEPEVITPNELALMVEPELVISDMSPLLSRGSVSGWVDDEHYSILLENQIENPRSLVDGLQFRRDPNVTHTINRGVLNLKMRSPRFEATRDTLLLVFSTLFGIAIGGLIEAFLVSSLRSRSPEVPVVKTKQHSQSAKDRATNTNSSQTGN